MLLSPIQKDYRTHYYARHYSDLQQNFPPILLQSSIFLLMRVVAL